jgi:peptidoglycan/LPS O-acetylase OafA/YrhL
MVHCDKLFSDQMSRSEILGRGRGQPSISNDRQNSFGALRLLLAILVVYTHACYLGGLGPESLLVWSHNTITAGTVAVQGFFVISGWLVCRSWRNNPSLGPFLWNRFLRLAPALWMCLVITAFVFTPFLWMLRDTGVASFFGLSPSPAGYVWHNLVLPRSQLTVGPFPDGGLQPGDWNGSLWTLSYEGACYLMIAALGILGLVTRWRALGTALIVALLTLHVVVAIMPDDVTPRLLLRLYDTPGKLLTLHFLAGAAWAAWPESSTGTRWSPGVAIGLILALGISWHYSVHPWLSPIIFPPALLALARRPELANFERWVGGDYSYGVYLYGYPVQQVLADFEVHRHGLVVYFLLSLLLALGCALASWRLIEKPALLWKSSRSIPRPALA